MQDLAVLAPSLIVCAAFLAGVYALLRHEMAPRRRTTEDGAPAEDMPAGGRITDQGEAPVVTAPDDRVADDHSAGRRSPGQA